MAVIKSYRDLRVYQAAMDAAMQVFEVTQSFPKEETYALVDQIRRSSRSVCTNLAEGGVEDATRRISSANSPMRRAKQRRLASGWSSRSGVSI